MLGHFVNAVNRYCSVKSLLLKDYRLIRPSSPSRIRLLLCLRFTTASHICSLVFIIRPSKNSRCGDCEPCGSE